MLVWRNKVDTRQQPRSRTSKTIEIRGWFELESCCKFTPSGTYSSPVMNCEEVREEREGKEKRWEMSTQLQSSTHCSSEVGRMSLWFLSRLRWSLTNPEEFRTAKKNRFSESFSMLSNIQNIVKICSMTSSRRNQPRKYIFKTPTVTVPPRHRHDVGIKISSAGI